jgi:hypothetical protein
VSLSGDGHLTGLAAGSGTGANQMAIIEAKFASVCACCKGKIQKGEEINYAKGEPVTHVNCEESMAARAYNKPSYGAALAKGYLPPEKRGTRDAVAGRAPKSTGDNPMAFDIWSDAESDR